MKQLGPLSESTLEQDSYCGESRSEIRQNLDASDHPEASVAFCNGLCPRPKIINSQYRDQISRILNPIVPVPPPTNAAFDSAWRLVHISPTMTVSPQNAASKSSHDMRGFCTSHHRHENIKNSCFKELCSSKMSGPTLN